MSILISCEVGGDSAPEQLRSKRRRALRKDAVEETRQRRTTSRSEHPQRGSVEATPDLTALYFARRLSKSLRSPLLENEYSTGLIDVTRSLHHRQLFSATTRAWPREQRQQLVELIYQPYRRRMRTAIGRMLSRTPYVVHLSVQSVPLRTGTLAAGKQRSDKKWRAADICRTDIGLLYDPAADDEVDLCLDWIDELYDELEMLRVRRNYPYRGTRDSITRAMRNEFRGRDYIGIEMIVNRAWAGRPVAIRDEVIDGIAVSLRRVLASVQSEAA